MGSDSTYILEQISYGPEYNRDQIIHCIQTLPESAGRAVEIRMGRNEKNDIALKDISVSRHHAKLILKNHKIYLKDCESRFGTFIEHRR